MAKTLKGFLKENVKESSKKTYQVEISDRFLDEEGNPIKWEIEALSPKNYMKIVNGTGAKVNAKTGEIALDDSSAAWYDLIGKCVKYPDLRDMELQDSYGVVGVPDLLDEMLNSKEFTYLNSVLTEIHSSKKDINDLVEEVKN